jgi:hypothetical protein
MAGKLSPNLQTSKPSLSRAGKDAGEKIVELSWQSVIGACLVSIIVAGCFPYIILKLGLGANISVVSALLGSVFLNATAFRTRGHNQLLNNMGLQANEWMILGDYSGR